MMILLRAFRELDPAYVAITFDVSGPTFRHEAYKEYKATREKKPDELYAQIPLTQRILEAMHIPVFTKQGFEADDIIGTLSRIAVKEDKNIRVAIVTGDMDTLQLVDDHVSVHTLRKGVNDVVVYDAAAVREKLGVGPDQIIDYKALRGDPSDNIPGVKGIGEKTAAQLLQKYGSIKKLYEALDKGKADDDIKEGVRKRLLDDRKSAELARMLCEIRRDVPIDFTLQKSAFVFPSLEDVRPIFEELSFNRLLQQFASAGPKQAAMIPTAETSSSAVVAVSDAKTVAAFEVALAGQKSVAFRSVVAAEDRVAPDVESVVMCVAGTIYVIRDKALLARVFENTKLQKICHDLKRESAALAMLGIAPKAPYFDLMLASYLLHPGERRHALDAVISMYGSSGADSGDESSLDEALRVITQFDAIATTLRKSLEEADLIKVLDGIEHPVALILGLMERDGIAIDAKYLQALSKDMAKKIAAIETRVYDLVGEEFNLNSPAQLGEVLFERVGIPVHGLKKTSKSKNISTAASELEKLRDRHPVIGEILAYRELAKLKSTYVDTIPELANTKTGRVHAIFNQVVAATGRLSSSDPNLQNIPTEDTEYGKKVRDGFVAEKGFVLIAADYSQFELRIAAHIANEPVMIAAFNNNEDIHRRTAAQMFGEAQADSQRKLAKTINFGVLYGMGSSRLSESAGISLSEAKDFIDRYFLVHKGISKYIEDTKEQVRTRGYVETLLGRKRYFPNFRLLGHREQAEAERQGINMPIQGTQADFVKLAMISVDGWLRKRFGADMHDHARLIVQVHDELVLEVREEDADEVLRELPGLMENVYKLKVPIVVNIAKGYRWGSIEDVK